MCVWEAGCVGVTASLPDEVSVKLNVEAPPVSLGTQLLHRGPGGAEHQLQVCLKSGAGLRARAGWLRIHGAPVETHAAPPSVPVEPVPLPGSEPGFPARAAAAPVALHVALLTQKHSFDHSPGQQVRRHGSHRCAIQPGGVSNLFMGGVVPVIGSELNRAGIPTGCCGL